jgi:hypothetical protein
MIVEEAAPVQVLVVSDIPLLQAEEAPTHFKYAAGNNSVLRNNVMANTVTPSPKAS